MSMPLPYTLARPLLFRMDAEAAHDLTLKLLEATAGTLAERTWACPLVHDPVTLAGLKFPNRVGLAAGLDKNARCIDAFAAMGFGFVEVGTVTPRAQPGNPQPRMFRLPQARALINRMGFNNDGLDAFIANVRRSRVRAAGAPLILGLNIGKNATTPIEEAANDYVLGLRGVYPYADYVSVNISSPNTKNLRSLQSDAALDTLLGTIARERETLAAAQGRRVPVFLKIAPDLTHEQIAAIADALLRHGMDGVIATNTTIDRNGVHGLPHAQETGGLSGAPLKQASNAVIHQLRARLGAGFPIIGVGGILSAADAVEKIRAGADVVQLYTGLIYRGPSLVMQVARALRAAGRTP
ncbi:MAG: dihydroorotate dehydrogenase (quinone) [Comamonas sp. SCN 67-35]|uniref:quinone-dependent dihydroorotate dehydrogenase n=1 Tax=unclassified Comamonas TaxID=2638500 RepID=UPI00086CAC11|nr:MULTISPECIES: quinone-dependent dihydroorotate dehydrogenase [unclassified Comamonas]MBN9330176.1 quinone-dependent dihydroorotate dehydrogenase [Comamonas sp.]ODU37661.1 MAG: dihydroorotate dehydrogenase (quinone) [Comamonas sp. SCN 67-35]OJW98723.1 MAG: dihydroorotate dehydrogenase (quinone) [Burkholderiales bacterium 66-26]